MSLPSKTREQRITYPESPIDGKYSRDGRLAIAHGSQLSIYQTDDSGFPLLATEEVVETRAHPERPLKFDCTSPSLCSLSWAPNQQEIAMTHFSEQVTLYSLERKEKRVLQSRQGLTRWLEFHPREPIIALPQDGLNLVWTNSAETRHFPHRCRSHQARWNRSGDLLAFGEGGKIVLWDLEKEEIHRAWPHEAKHAGNHQKESAGYETPIESFAWGDQLLAVGIEGGQIQLWDTRQEKKITEWKILGIPVSYLAIKEERIAVPRGDGLLEVFDLRGKRLFADEVWNGDAHRWLDGIYCTEWSPKGWSILSVAYEEVTLTEVKY